jgi:hypothetical protein
MSENKKQEHRNYKQELKDKRNELSKHQAETQKQSIIRGDMLVERKQKALSAHMIAVAAIKDKADCDKEVHRKNYITAKDKVDDEFSKAVSALEKTREAKVKALDDAKQSAYNAINNAAQESTRPHAPQFKAELVIIEEEYVKNNSEAEKAASDVTAALTSQVERLIDEVAKREEAYRASRSPSEKAADETFDPPPA